MKDNACLHNNGGRSDLFNSSDKNTIHFFMNHCYLCANFVKCTWDMSDDVCTNCPSFETRIFPRYRINRASRVPDKILWSQTFVKEVKIKFSPAAIGITLCGFNNEQPSVRKKTLYYWFRLIWRYICTEAATRYDIKLDKFAFHTFLRCNSHALWVCLSLALVSAITRVEFSLYYCCSHQSD